MQLSWAAIVLGTLGLDAVLAHPSIHGHHHHIRRQTYDISGVDFNNIDYGKVAAAEAKDPTFNPYDPKNAAKFAKDPSKVNSAPAPSGGNGGNFKIPAYYPPGTSQPATAPFTEASSAFGQESPETFGATPDQYGGNVGIPYGSNIIVINDQDAPKFPYKALFYNHLEKDMVVQIWNKKGRDGKPQSGSFGDPVVNFKVGPGKSRYVAFQQNTQCGWIVNPGPRNAWGQQMGTWGEADLCSKPNKGNSGYDVSRILQGSAISPYMEISSSRGMTSASDYNSYDESNKNQGGIGGNIAPGPLTMNVHIGGPKYNPQTEPV